MTTSNPIIPPGSPLHKPASARLSKFSLAVFAVLAVHAALLAGLLMQGCKRDDRAPGLASEELPADAILIVNTNEPEQDLILPPDIGDLPVPPTNGQPTIQFEPALPPPVESAMKSYTVVAGDTFAKIAKKYGVSLDALVEANLDFDPQRIQPGQKIQIPTSTAVQAAAPKAEAPKGPESSYIVKSGDTLTAIAKTHGVTIDGIRAANNLRTDRILVGQRLKIPAPANPSNPSIPPLTEVP
jgi:LysM repeat protein